MRGGTDQVIAEEHVGDAHAIGRLNEIRIVGAGQDEAIGDTVLTKRGGQLDVGGRSIGRIVELFEDDEVAVLFAELFGALQQPRVDGMEEVAVGEDKGNDRSSIAGGAACRGRPDIAQRAGGVVYLADYLGIYTAAVVEDSGGCAERNTGRLGNIDNGRMGGDFGSRQRAR